MKNFIVGILILFAASIPLTSYGKTAIARINSAAGIRIGTVVLTELKNGVRVQAQFRNLTPGFHGFHIHSAGQCQAPFTSAGPHFELLGRTHRDHNGDMPVMLARANGLAIATFITDRFKIADLFDADGSAFIIHDGPDNYANIPTDRYTPAPDATTLATGDAGPRFGCGVVSAK
ncbi:MAG: superoxide dismutase family protein [Methyloglobulus sp.]|nr:superoxide dismutase family protein [Methyloglobulus sp.]